MPEDAVLASIDDPRVMFTAVNDFLHAMGRPRYFDVKLVGLSKEVRLHNGAFSVHIDALLQDVLKTDLVIVPAIGSDFNSTLDTNKGLVPWIVNQYENGAEVMSLCSGAFLLAYTGLLNGKHCSTHWMHANTFRSMFPDVHLADKKIITEEQGIYTSGGATSYWNLFLYFVEKYVGRDIAIMASKYFVLEMDRYSQSEFTMFKGQKEHEDDAIKMAQEYIETNYTERITVDQLVTMFSIGRRSFERRFKKATSNTVVEYIHRVKIEAAKKSLESSNNRVSEVVYHVGFSDPKAFRTSFKRITGLSPLQYRNKYNPAAQVSE